MVQHRHVVIGFQASGKTTYAAALWHLVDSRDVPTALVKGRHNGDYRYLERIASAWEQGWQADHTALGTWQPITVNLKHEGSHSEVALSFVDMSGETFEQVFATREFDEQIEDMVRGCEGLMLFVTALRFADDVTIVDIGVEFPDEMPVESDMDEDEEGDSPMSQSELLAPIAAQEGAAVVEEVVPSSVGPDVFTPARTPRQVQMTDLLDSLSDQPIGMAPSRVAVIVSAWDKAPPGFTPERWLAERMPLLDQYLKSHANLFETRVYGVSAQGGVLPRSDQQNVPNDRAALLAQRIASRRIRVVGHGAGPHDLTHPIAWLGGSS